MQFDCMVSHFNQTKNDEEKETRWNDAVDGWGDKQT